MAVRDGRAAWGLMAAAILTQTRCLLMNLTPVMRDQDIFINNHTEIRELVEQISSVIRGEIPVLSPNKEVWDKPGFQAKLKRLQAAIK